MKRVSKDQILQHLAIAGTRSAAEIAEEFDCSISQIHYKCDEMVLDGLLEKDKRPTRVTRINGRTYNRDAIKVYRVRVQPPVQTPETKLEVEGTHTPRDGELRFTFPEKQPSDADDLVAALRRILTPEEMAARGITLPPADHLLEVVGEAMAAHEVYSKYELTESIRAGLAARGLAVTEV